MFNRMNINIIVLVKYIVCTILIMAVVCAPAYLARQTKQDKTNMARIRIASWILGWSLIAWIWALFQSTKK